MSTLPNTAAPSAELSASRSEPSANRSWMRALELTAPIPRRPNRLMLDVVSELAVGHPHASALLSDKESFSYSKLTARACQYARWARAQGVQPGDVVGLLMHNRPEYYALWLGITSAGGVVALLNTNLTGASLAHSIEIVGARDLIVEDRLLEDLRSALPLLTRTPAVWNHGGETSDCCSLHDSLDRQSEDPLTAAERPAITIDDRALYIYTSGTTGLPKAVNISHGRILQWSHWFAGMIGVGPEDRLYNCLPMYHSIGGVLVPGAALAGAGSVVLREKFSASRFWDDVARWDCTVLQYIGEFCRYLLHTASSASDRSHRVRLACGNGLAPDLWEPFRQRFAIPKILEFYASTEGAVSLFNAEGKPGAIGRVPSYLTHRFAPALVEYDVERDEPVRDAQGFCIPCAVNQPGEALSKLSTSAQSVATRFEGYSDEAASERKVLRNVFARGDAWFRTGDLMRRDERGFFYFVDRIGDTFRWKGENVATTEVADALCGFPGILHAVVYGVKVPGSDGRAGMAALCVDDAFDLEELHPYLSTVLPPYARPVFLRLQNEAAKVAITGTFKYSKQRLMREGFDPASVAEPLYCSHPRLQTFVPLDARFYEEIRSRVVRL